MKKLIYGVFVLTFTVSAAGGILNGSFECSEPNGTAWFDPPCDWDYVNYAGVHRSFTPVPEPENQRAIGLDWSVPPAVDGQHFCVLSTGDMGEGSDPLINVSRITQRITLAPGDYLKGSYFFGTCDWEPYIDEASITLVAVERDTEPNYVELAYVNVSDVGDVRSLDGWQPIFYAYTGTQTNVYDLKCEVRDVRDNIFKSYLAVDDFHVCRVSEREGDLNRDCQVNLTDFALLSWAWMATCSDPNTYDPNAPCDFADMDDSDFVDCGDLDILSDWWLFTTP